MIIDPVLKSIQHLFRPDRLFPMYMFEARLELKLLVLYSSDVTLHSLASNLLALSSNLLTLV